MGSGNGYQIFVSLCLYLTFIENINQSGRYINEIQKVSLSSNLDIYISVNISDNVMKFQNYLSIITMCPCVENW